MPLEVYLAGPISGLFVVAIQFPTLPASKEGGFITNRPLKIK